MTINEVVQFHPSSLLRRVLQANALFCGLSGAVMIAFPGALAALIGLSQGYYLTGLGIILLLYAAELFWLTRRQPVSAWVAWMAIELDVAWVVASAVVLVWDPLPFTAAGWWAVAVIADIVTLFAAVQYYALRRRL